MPRKQIRKTNTNAALSAAFWKLYIKKPVSEITIKELTLEAGVHRSSFYGHYDDIYALLEYNEQQLLDGITSYMDFSSLTGDSRSPIDMIVRFYQENLHKLSVLMGDHGDPGFIIRFKEQVIPCVLEHMAIPRDNKKCYYIIDFIVSSMLTFLTSWYLNEGSMPPENIIKYIRSAIMNGCAAPLSESTNDIEAFRRFFTICRS